MEKGVYVVVNEGPWDEIILDYPDVLQSQAPYKKVNKGEQSKTMQCGDRSRDIFMSEDGTIRQGM